MNQFTIALCSVGFILLCLLAFWLGRRNPGPDYCHRCGGSGWEPESPKPNKYRTALFEWLVDAYGSPDREKPPVIEV